MNKRLFTLFLALTAVTVSTLADTYYGIKVAGVKVTSSNYKNVEKNISGIKGYSSNTNANLGDPSISYDPDNKTLTIWNVKLTSSKQIIYNESCEGLTIVFKGGNSISTSGSQTIRIEKKTTIKTQEWTDGIDNKTTYITCTGTSSDHDAIRLYKGVTLTIRNAFLEISSKRSCFDVEGSDPTLQILSSTVKATCNARSSGDDYAIKNCKLQVRNSTVTLTGYYDKAVSGIVSYTTASGMEDLTPNVGDGSAKFNSSNKTFYDSNGKLAKTVKIQPMLAINTTNFPDANFRSYLSSQSYGSDNYLSTKELNSVTAINVSNKSIGNLKGIEYFTALTELRCYGNSLKSLDVTKNTKLTILNCLNNGLTSLNVAKNTALKELYCGVNSLTSLNVSKNTSLTILSCFANQIDCSAMESLINSLVDLSKTGKSGTFQVFNGSYNTENNVISPSQVTKVNNKGWNTQYYNGSLWVAYSGASGMEINTTNFPDQNFRSFLTSQNYGEDGFITDKERNLIEYMNLRSLGIKNLTGVDFFNQLLRLDIIGNQIEGEAMENLVKNLPITKGDLYVYSDKAAVNNVITPPQVNKANDRGWKVRQADGSGYDGCEGIEIRYNFPSVISKFIEKLDPYNDGFLTKYEIETITELNLTGIDLNGVKSMGLENLTSLRKLIVNNCKLDNLDGFFGKEKNTINLLELTWLEAKGNQLTSLDGNRLPMLKYLDVSNNKLESLDLSEMSDLEQLYCDYNLLTNLDASKNTKLTTLGCSNNNLSVLNVLNTKLTSLYCHNNNLSYLDIFGGNNLQTIHCYGNNIKGAIMDDLVNSLPKVSSGIICITDNNDGNVITPRQVTVATGKGWIVKAKTSQGSTNYQGHQINIDIDNTNFPDATFRSYLLAQEYGKDGVLDEEDIMSVTEMDLKEKSIGNLKGVEHFWYMITLDCSNNNLASLDLSQNTVLRKLVCNYNKLTELLLPKVATLNTVECYHNELTDLDVESNTNLSELMCFNNKLEKLDVTHNKELTVLTCDNNQLKALDLSSNSKLTELSCASNMLTELNVSASKELEYLSCSDNSLSILNLLLNTKLSSLRCQDNQLTSLYISNPELVYLYCYNNKLTSLDASSCQRLTTLHCYANDIRGEAMENLVNGLPKKNGAIACVFRVCSSDYEQDNSIKPEQVKKAREKKWTVQKWNGTKWVENRLGDANGDDVVNSADIVEMINAKKNNSSKKFQLDNVDFDGDGIVTDSDIDTVVNIIMGK